MHTRRVFSRFGLVLAIIYQVHRVVSDKDATSMHTKSILESQIFQRILENIEKRLLIIDKFETKIDILTTKIEIFDAKLDQAQSKLESLKDHINRKSDSIYERLNHRISYIENKFEKNVAKLMTKLESTIEMRQSEIENDLLVENIQYLEEIKTSISNMEMSNNLTQKTTDIKLDRLESNVKDVLLTANTTKREIQENIRSFSSQIGRKILGSTKNLTDDHDHLYGAVKEIETMFQRKIGELNRKMDTQYYDTRMAQNLFIDSCHRIQLDEPQLEAKITLVLEKLLDSFTNKSSKTYREIQRLQDLVLSHDSSISTKVGLARNTLLEMAQKSFAYKQEILDSISEVRTDLDQLLVATKTILSNSSDSSNTDQINTINSLLLEIQQHISNIDNKNNEELLDQISKLNVQLVTTNLENVTSTISVGTNQSIDEQLQKHLENIYDMLQVIEIKLNRFETHDINRPVHSGYFEKLWRLHFPSNMTHFSNYSQSNFDSNLINSRMERWKNHTRNKFNLTWNNASVASNVTNLNANRTTDDSEIARIARLVVHKLLDRSEVNSSDLGGELDDEENFDEEY